MTCYLGEGVGNWDGHKTIANQYPGHANILDQPSAALLRDLKSRGLLGLDRERLRFYHNGIERRLTDVHGHVVSGILT